MKYGIKIKYKVIPCDKYNEYCKGLFAPAEYERTRYFDTEDLCKAYRNIFLDGTESIIREEISSGIFKQTQLEEFFPHTYTKG